MRPGKRQFLAVFSVITAGVAQTPARTDFGLDGPTTLSLLDALGSTLSTNPSIGVQQQQVLIQRGIQQQAAGAFDTSISGSGSQDYSQQPLPAASILLDEYELGITAPTTDTNQTQIEASATKLFRNGISMGPELQLTRIRDNIDNQNGLSQATLAYQVTIPLLRNRGRDAVAAQETSARIGVQAGLYDLNQLIATLLANTANAYWNDVAARDSLRVARETEARGRTILDETQALIEGDQEPRSDISEVAANLADRISSRIAAEQQAIESHQSLALAMGLGRARLDKLPNPAMDLPGTGEIVLPAADPASIQSDIDVALRRRADVLAARQRVEAARVLLPAARNALLPQLNAQGTIGYAGLKEGPGFAAIVYPPFVGTHGVQASGTLTFSFPPANNVALGELEQANASFRQAQLRYEDTARNIASGVISAVAGVRTASDRLASARESVRRFQDALEAERAKHELAQTPLINVLTVEDRLTSAQQTEVAARAGYVEALVQLRLATGTIVAPDKPVQTVTEDLFARIPPEVASENAH